MELDSTQAVPQPTLSHDLDAETCELLLVRHGRSADVVPGSAESADPPLHVDGVAQADALARRLATLELHGVYSSHLARAVQTATPLAEARGFTVGVDPDLEEVRLGEWGNGEFRRRAAARDPEWLAWSMTGRWDGIPGGEGDAALRTRVRGAVERIAARHRGQRVAIVAHGGAINAFLADVLGIERTMWMAVENTSISLVRISDSYGPHVVTVNDCHHLYDPVAGIG